MSNQEVKPTLILGMRRRIARKFVMRVEELGLVKKEGEKSALLLSGGRHTEVEDSRRSAA